MQTEPATSVLEQTVERLRRAYRDVRGQTERLCEGLAIEDFVLQSMPDASPTRWHLAHTTWFFETFVLARALSSYVPYAEGYEYLFNSYYNSLGPQYPRPRRGLLSRPTVAEIWEYRRAIDAQIDELLTGDPNRVASVLAHLELGLHHEQQHQELILTDLKHALFQNPLFPAYAAGELDSARHGRSAAASLEWIDLMHGLHRIGHAIDGFAFDNERPAHQVFIPPCQLASRLVTCGEYMEFIEDGGYRRPELWLSLGWQTVQDERWEAPLYWVRTQDGWREYTLRGLEPLDVDRPVSHVSYFEADAYARWAGAQLPTEQAWEIAARPLAIEGNLLERHVLHPLPAAEPHSSATGYEAPSGRLYQIWGDLWEWTASPYTAYPGYAPPEGAIGEYNGKFMCNQYVLRGGSCATPRSHIRATYRNFFPPAARWQFTGIRLARIAAPVGRPDVSS